MKEGNYDEVLNYLNHYDIDLEYINEEHDDCTALVIAASEGYFNICQLLIEKGANMYAGNSVSAPYIYYYLTVLNKSWTI